MTITHHYTPKSDETSTFFSLRKMDGLYNITTHGLTWSHHGLLCFSLLEGFFEELCVRSFSSLLSKSSLWRSSWGHNWGMCSFHECKCKWLLGFFTGFGQVSTVNAPQFWKTSIYILPGRSFRTIHLGIIGSQQKQADKGLIKVILCGWKRGSSRRVLQRIWGIFVRIQLIRNQHVYGMDFASYVPRTPDMNQSRMRSQDWQMYIFYYMLMSIGICWICPLFQEWFCVPKSRYLKMRRFGNCHIPQ